jgi:DNA replication protein DnaC
MTTTVNNLAGAIQELARGRIVRPGETGECSRHPEHTWRGCPNCTAELAAIEEREAAAERAAAEQHRASLLAEAEQVNATFPGRYRHAITDRADVSDWVQQFRRDPRNTPSLLLLGPTGTGKTHQGYGAVRGAVHTLWTTAAGITRHPSHAVVSFADFCAAMRPGGEVDAEAEMQRLRRVDLVMIDDLGAAKHSDWVEENTYRLVNGRYEDARPSIFTSNLPLPLLKEAIGDRIASRLAEMCTRVILDGPDRRRARHRAE